MGSVSAWIAGVWGVQASLATDKATCRLVIATEASSVMVQALATAGTARRPQEVAYTLEVGKSAGSGTVKSRQAGRATLPGDGETVLSKVALGDPKGLVINARLTLEDESGVFGECVHVFRFDPSGRVIHRDLSGPAQR